jgi:hypothetical protein
MLQTINPIDISQRFLQISPGGGIGSIGLPNALLSPNSNASTD